VVREAHAPQIGACGVNARPRDALLQRVHSLTLFRFFASCARRRGGRRCTGARAPATRRWRTRCLVAALTWTRQTSGARRRCTPQPTRQKQTSRASSSPSALTRRRETACVA
jgi:hypothetical protein